MIKNKKEAQCALICFKPFGIVQTALHIARCSLPYSSRLEAKQREHYASSSSSLHSGLINRSQCLSASEVGLKNCLASKKLQYRFVPRTGTKGARGATASLVPVRGTNRDNLFQSIRISSGNSSVTKGFHFLKHI